ncbi:DUF2877 domain-containing protein [Brevibacterium sp. CS2]|uniref:oxamate carbamoyltransferase subunit AllH family protein n=1 Tax=Brevibacterium sp. CS2 TaxID=2575923 RepID=UPI0010C789B2|nr:DUF2877 domain-containing protein [Brevibacterium sp. CS2]QCP06280.1 DUF2877 domain-containing protein [Brevibacterium sp. CS2]
MTTAPVASTAPPRNPTTARRPAPAQLAAAASTLTSAAGPGPWQVVGIMRHGFYAASETGAVLPVLGPTALRLPTAVLVPELTGDRLASLQIGAALRVESGRIMTEHFHCAIRRRWNPTRIRPCDPARRASAASVSASIAHPAWPEPGIEDLAHRAARLVHVGRALDPGAVDSALAALLGLGPGSTPSGDDAVCGVLLALRQVRAVPALDLLRNRLRAALAARPAPTGGLSASLLDAAAAGACVPEVRAALELLVSGAPAGPIARAVAAVGTSSGADILCGAAAVHLTDATAPDSGPAAVPPSASPVAPSS